MNPEPEVFHSKAKITIAGEELILLPEKAVFWPAGKLLLLSDLHFGKVSHFRKAGIPVPMQATGKNFEILEKLIDNYQPETICFLGDLFHSTVNKEWEAFKYFRQAHPAVKMILVRGNHDIMGAARYKDADVKVYPVCHDEGPFLFCHENVGVNPGKYVISGHIHPAVKLKGKGRQSILLPCFYFGKKQAFLPAFGTFTGMVPLKPEKGSRIFGITEEKVFEVRQPKPTVRRKLPS